MILEKDKVYKVKHVSYVHIKGWRDYIIFSPIEDVDIPEDYFTCHSNSLTHPKFNNIKTHFTICFDKLIETEFDKRHGYLRPSVTGIDHLCTMLEITNDDLEDIRKAIHKLGHGFCYNRKLNKLVKHDAREEQSIQMCSY